MVAATGVSLLFLFGCVVPFGGLYAFAAGDDDLETGPQGVAVSLRQVERKVDLEASPILGRLRQAIRGGSAEA